jgi:hypothetical protein
MRVWAFGKMIRSVYFLSRFFVSGCVKLSTSHGLGRTIRVKRILSDLKLSLRFVCLIKGA